MSVFKSTFQSFIDGKHPSADQVKAVMTDILNGKSNDAQVASFLLGLEIVGVTTEDIRIGAELLRENMIPVNIEGTLIDIVGTGGDGHSTFNISTAATFVAAGAGAKVAKHGNKAVSSKSGSSDVLSSLGVELDIPPSHAAICVEECGVGFLFAPNHHQSMRHVGPARAALGLRTLFNLLGPMCNPAGAKRQIIGVFDKKWSRPMAEALKELGSVHAWIVHGKDGLDEITTTDTTFVTELKNGKIKNLKIHPEDYGIKLATLEDLKGGDSTVNAESLMSVLQGKEGPYRDIVLMNSGAALVVAGIADDLQDGIVRSRQSIESGAAYQKLEALIRVSHQ